MSRNVNYHSINGELLSNSKICNKYHMAYKTLQEKLSEFNNDDRLLEEWLNSRGDVSRIYTIPVTILGKLYRSITSASKQLHIAQLVLKSIIDLSKSQEEIDSKVSAILEKRNFIDENRLYNGNHYNNVSGIYESEGLSPSIEATYKSRVNKGEDLTREYFIKEYKVSLKLKSNGVLSLNELDGLDIGRGFIKDVVIGDKIYSTYKIAACSYNVSVSTIRSALKLKDYSEREKYVISVTNRRFSQKFGMPIKVFSKVYNVSVYSINKVFNEYLDSLNTTEDLLQKLNEYKNSYQVTFFNKLFDSNNDVIRAYGIVANRSYSFKDNSQQQRDYTLYEWACSDLNSYFKNTKIRPKNINDMYSSIIYIYSYIDMSYFLCTNSDGTQLILSNKELLELSYGKERVEKLKNCIKEYKSIYENGGGSIVKA